MIKLKTADVNEFLKRTSGIRQTGIVPILDHVLLEVTKERATLCETNQAIWCLHEIECDGKPGEKMLIEKKMLAAVAMGSRAEYLSLKKTGDHIEISDGVNKPRFKLPDDKVQFPLFPEKEDKAKVSLLPEELFTAIGQAIPYMSGDEGLFFYIYTKSTGESESNIFASDAFVFFHRKFKFDLPALKLTKDQAKVLSMYKEANHHEAGNYDFFDCGLTTYGFIKSEQPAPPYEKVIGQFDPALKFTIDKEQVIDFANLALRITPLSYCLFTIQNSEKDDGILRLSFQAENYGRSNEIEMKVETNFHIEKQNLNAKQVPLLFNTFAASRLDLYKVGMTTFIKSPDDPGTTLIMSSYQDDFVPASK